MPIYRLDQRLVFPPAEGAEPSGIVAVGGDLSPQRLLLAYASGIFPWYDEGVPILWHSPDPRYVLPVEQLVVPRSTAKTLRRGTFEVRFDERFGDVIRACSSTPRPGQRGTWITEDMQQAYIELYELGFAHSAEAYKDGRLVGGLYGVSLGSIFFGESMFAREPEASKVAFVELARFFSGAGVDLIDCQVHTEHLERFGAEHWPRARYLAELATRLERPTLRGRWRSGLQARALAE